MGIKSYIGIYLDFILISRATKQWRVILISKRPQIMQIEGRSVCGPCTLDKVTTWDQYIV